jgi:uncharacterized membrane protein
MENIKKIKYFLNKYAITILVVAILFYIAIFFSISCFKYNNFYYDSLDLAIFNQVFYNTSHGRFFQLSIHEPTYLGDHFAPIILVLSIFYSFFQSPLALLFLQTMILALTAWPIYLISKKIIGGNIWPLIIGVIWLMNPFVQNANLFEFHILPFAVFFIFWVFYFYLQKKWTMFFLFSFLSLLVREDVSLVIFMFGVLAVVDWAIVFTKTRKHKNMKTITQEEEIEKLRNSEIKSALDEKKPSSKALELGFFSGGLFFGLILCLISAFWLIFSLKIIGAYAPAGQYKFFIYYSWLGNSFSEIVINIFLHPLKLLSHFITIYNLEMILGLLLAFCFLPLLSKKYLILLLGPVLQLMIGSPGGSALILQTHYSLLLLPGLFISFIYALKRFLREPLGQKSSFGLIRILSREKGFLIIIFTAGLIYSSLTLGPLVGSVHGMIVNRQDKSVLEIKNYFADQIPKNASVATTYEYLTNLSSRERVYSMHYGFVGKKQYSDIDYQIPKETEYLLINFNDFFLYNVQFPDMAAYKRFFNSGDDNMRNLFKDYELVEIFDNYALFKLSANKNVMPLYRMDVGAPKYEQNLELEGKIKFMGWEINSKNFISPPLLNKYKNNLIPLSLFFKAETSLATGDPEIPAENYQLKMLITNQKGDILYEKFYPLGYGIFPTSEWSVGEIIQNNYWFYIPEKFSDSENILQFSLTQVSGHMELNCFRRTKLEYKESSLSPTIVIDKIKNLK